MKIALDGAGIGFNIGWLIFGGLYPSCNLLVIVCSSAFLILWTTMLIVDLIRSNDERQDNSSQ